jgi:uncharacterized metal-binding protein YceD (DUF177 family)
MTREAERSYPVSWKVHLHDLPRSGRQLTIHADEGQRAAIAQFADLREVPAFDAELALAPADRGGVRITGILHAEVIQTCVVSLQPVPDSLEVDIHRSFAPAEPRRRGHGDVSGELVIAFDEEDPPEPLPSGDLDLAGILIEEFLLALDPYPRHPEAVLDRSADDDDDDSHEAGPFAGLKALKEDKKARKP